MDTRPTIEDMKLVLQLYDMRREDRMREARRWFSTSFKVKTLEELNAACPPGSETQYSYRMVTTYWEMVGSFLTSGVLNRPLFYQSGRELLFVWERFRDVLPAIRESTQNPLEYTNLELAAKAFIEWWNTEAPGAYDAFSKRVRA